MNNTASKPGRRAQRLARALSALLAVVDKPDWDESDHAQVERARAVLATFTKESTPEVKPIRFTNIPIEWHGVDLFAWGSKGLRGRDGHALPGANGRAVKYFPFSELTACALVKVYTGNPKLIRRLKKLTPEVWCVHERKGKFWVRKFYLVPAKAVEIVCASMGTTLEALESEPLSPVSTVTEADFAACIEPVGAVA